MFLMKPAMAALAAALTLTTFAPTADAGYRRHGYGHGYGYFFPGAAGFAAGAIFGSLLAAPYRYGHYGYYDDYYGYPPPYYYGRRHYYRPYREYYAPSNDYYYDNGGYYDYGCDNSGAVSRPAHSQC
jgi:hypothetical protein